MNKNQITQKTSAYFEQTLDYVIVKVPRWNFDKFEGSDRTLGLQMKAVGEVMGIGRNFQEALQKACQSLEIKRNGLGADAKELRDRDEILYSLKNPSWNRLFHVYDAFKLGIPFKSIQEATKIDKWFLTQIEELIWLEREIEKYKLDTIPPELMREAKEKGYADRQIAHLMGCLESQVHKRRTEMGITRVYKLVDTCAAEFQAQTPYYYSTFESDMIVLEKWKPNKPISVVYFDGERERYYVKRFMIEHPDREEKFISEHPGSKLMIVAMDFRPMAEVIYSKRSLDNEILNFEEFIAVKGIKALGNQLTAEKIKDINGNKITPKQKILALLQEKSRYHDIKSKM